jgi:hypothetical protein
LGEVLINYGSGGGGIDGASEPEPFRSLFPVRYYLNDFELSAMFDPDSDPSARLVSGIPTARYSRGAEDYGKDLPPEAFLDAPYCPFKMDVFQFGLPCKEIFSVSCLPLLTRAECAESFSPEHDIIP